MQDTALRAPELAAWLANTDIGLLELRTPTGTLRLGRQGDNIVELPEEETEEAESVQVKAPSVGTYLHSHPSAAGALASVGQRVNTGQVIGLLNIGPLLLPVTAPQTGVVDAIHVANGVAVGYGTVLIDLHPL